MTESIDQMPDTARVWIYQSDRPFTTQEEQEIATAIQRFISQWAAHGQKLMAAFTIQHHQFIVLSVDESVAQASGCSIDASVELIRQIESHFKLNLLDRTKVAFLIDGEVTLQPFSKLKDEIIAGVIDEKTKVFNNLIEKTGDWKTNWVVPAGETWINRYFS